MSREKRTKEIRRTALAGRRAAALQRRERRRVSGVGPFFTSFTITLAVLSFLAGLLVAERNISELLYGADTQAAAELSFSREGEGEYEASVGRASVALDLTPAGRALSVCGEVLRRAGGLLPVPLRTTAEGAAFLGNAVSEPWEAALGWGRERLAENFREDGGE